MNNLNIIDRFKYQTFLGSDTSIFDSFIHLVYYQCLIKRVILLNTFLIHIPFIYN